MLKMDFVNPIRLINHSLILVGRLNITIDSMMGLCTRGSELIHACSALLKLVACKFDLLVLRCTTICSGSMLQEA